MIYFFSFMAYFITPKNFSISQVGILGNASDFYEDGPNGTLDNSLDRRQMMIAFDMRYGV